MIKALEFHEWTINFVVLLWVVDKLSEYIQKQNYYRSETFEIKWHKSPFDRIWDVIESWVKKNMLFYFWTSRVKVINSVETL